MNARTRNGSLDILRAVAVLLTLGAHMPYFHFLERAGWIGVDLFFVLSGFLISGLLFQEYKCTGQLRIRRFLIRRGLKIYPSYYLLIAAAVALSFVRAEPTLRVQALMSAVFLQGYLYPNMTHVFRSLFHLWSIAVEEHFYFSLPLLLLLLIRRRSLGAIPVIFGFLAVVCPLFRITNWVASHARFDSLFAGVTLGYLFHFRRAWFDRLTKGYLMIPAALLISPAFLLQQSSLFMRTVGVTGLMVGFTLVVAWSVIRVPENLVFRFMAKVGFYSYSIYLWHVMVRDVFFGWARIISLPIFIIYLTVAVGIGIAMAHLVEIPYLRMRERLFPPADSLVRDLRLTHVTNPVVSLG